MLGINELKKELEEDYGHQNINNLCKVVDHNFQLCCLQSAKPLDSFVDQFANLMMIQNKSPILFIRVLDKKVREALARSDALTINDIHSNIWQLAFTFCHQLVNSLADQSIKLSFVDKHLKNFSSSLLNDLENLTKALGKCSQCVPKFSELDVAVKRVEDYWRLCKYQDGAQVFLQLRDVLNLTGDFEFIESRFAVQV